MRYPYSTSGTARQMQHLKAADILDAGLCSPKPATDCAVHPSATVAVHILHQYLSLKAAGPLPKARALRFNASDAPFYRALPFMVALPRSLRPPWAWLWLLRAKATRGPVRRSATFVRQIPLAQGQVITS